MKIRLRSKFSIGETTFEMVKITDNALLIIKTVTFHKYPNLFVEPTYTIVLIEDKASTDIWALNISTIINCKVTFPWTRLEERLVKKYQNLLTKRVNMLFYLATNRKRRRL